MTRRNRVDPFGDLHAASERGMFTGNRGCLVDAGGQIARHHRGSLWIVCVTEYRDWRNPLAAPGRWTPIFFLDDAVALAAGHRPCGLCRRADYQSYRDAVTRAVGARDRLSATDLNRLLATQRLRRGGGIERAADRRTWQAEMHSLPVGAVIVGGDGRPRLVLRDRVMTFGFEGWSEPEPWRAETVTVLTPPASVGALSMGFVPTLHVSAVTVAN